MNKKNIYFIIIFLVLILILPRLIKASLIDELRQKISDNNSQIAEIQKEIEELQKQLDKTGKDANTLKNQIRQLETTIQKLRTDIKLTEKRITITGFVIEELIFGIKAKEKEIENSKKVLAEIIRNMNEAESQSLIEILLAHASFSDFFTDIENMNDFQDKININLQQLKNLREDFKNQEKEKEGEKKEMENLYSQLDDQKQLVELQKNQKNILLKDTKNKESAYKKLLADREAKVRALESEIQAFENQIRIEIDPNSLPSTGSGVLLWPVDNPVITQYFGNTPFATQNPQVYNSKGHNGIDLRASIGTPIKSAASGVVTDTGDTDKSCNGVSYGKWVLIKHDNNISTLYAHFSLIKASPGQQVSAGQIIGYSGDTGYATGPHLHFGVFATQAIAGFEYRSKICGTIMKLPILAPNGYLNPLSYL